MVFRTALRRYARLGLVVGGVSALAGATPTDAPMARHWSLLSPPAQGAAGNFVMPSYAPPEDPSVRSREDDAVVARRKEQLRRSWPFIVMGIGGGALVTGGFLGVAARDTGKRAVAARFQDDADRELKAGRGQATAANALWISGGAVVLGGAASWLILHLTSKP